MFKTINLLKRKEGTSLAQFIDYYETHHSKLGEQFFPTATRYERRYLHPVAPPVTGVAPDTEFDVVMEMWFEDEAAFVAATSGLLPEQAEAIRQDELNFLDPTKSRMYTVQERASVMTGAQP